jgi:hypothetical protein
MEVTTVSSIVEDEDLDHSMNEEVGVDSIAKFYQLVLHALWCMNLSKSASRTAEKKNKNADNVGRNQTIFAKNSSPTNIRQHNSARL